MDTHNTLQRPGLPFADAPITRVDTYAQGRTAATEAPFTRPERNSRVAVATAHLVGKAMEPGAEDSPPPDEPPLPSSPPGESDPEAASATAEPPEHSPEQSGDSTAVPPESEEAEPGPPDTASSGDDGGNDDPPADPPVPSPEPEEPPDEPQEPQEPEQPEPTRLRLPPLRMIRERAAERAERAAARYAEEERTVGRTRQPYWSASDSRLEGGDDAFGTWFKEVLPADDNLKQHIEDTLEPLTPRIGIELGGVGSRLFSDFTPGFFDASIGVNLTDTRQASFDRFAIMGRDLENNHRVVEGNVLKPETIQKVDDLLGGHKAALIVERMYAGIGSMPEDPFALAKNAGVWYERLAEGGLMLAQVPPALTPIMEGWKNMVAAQAPAVDVQLGSHKGYSLVRIHKLPGSPETLPVISARKLMEERRDLAKNFFRR